MASPSDAELQNALAQLRGAHPALGIPKLHARLRVDFPAWAVSEKRVRKVLATLPKDTTEGEDATTQNKNATTEEKEKEKEQDKAAPHPTSQLIPGLDVAQWTPRVAVRVFDRRKGKGLVATKKIGEGETIWVEDPFVIAPEWEIYDKQRAGAACSLCTTLFAHPSEARARCPHCPAAFCNTLCRKRADKTHPLLCPAQNPASMPLLRWVRTHEWMALHALAQCTARLLLANKEANKEALEADWAVIRGFAALGLEERARYSFRAEPDRTTWKSAFALFCQAFQRPRQEGASVKNLTDEEKRVAAILRRPLPDEIETALFDYDAGFLRGLGRMSLNLEAHGGLYTLHSHLNHACAPNVSVRHLDQRRALSRITVRALADIAVGQELFITYVDPSAGYAARRAELDAWGFVCACKRCVEEGREWGPLEGSEALGDLGDLAGELKRGLGVM
ncbi:hypothetical protein C8R44DRAFT_756745 [Mycena epipterygia]|nr:hypothetical protein C8R44DRAFT_756745 [Mycena epipterygia]